jgi:hypothetical protein
LHLKGIKHCLFSCVAVDAQRSIELLLTKIDNGAHFCIEDLLRSLH